MSLGVHLAAPAHVGSWPLTTDIAGASECPMLGVSRAPDNALHSHGCLCISAKNKPGKEKWSSLPHETEPSQGKMISGPYLKS